MTRSQSILLAALSNGAKDYDQLRTIVPNLDGALRSLLQTGAITLIKSLGPGRYMIPLAATDEPEQPKRPVLRLPRPVNGPTKVCDKCLQVRRITQFGRRKDQRKNTCYACNWKREKELRQLRESA